MQLSLPSFLVTLLASQVAFAALNQPCYGTNGTAGVCVRDSTCTSIGGVTVNGGCPRDPSDVKCCSKPSCGSSTDGNCRWVSDCAGSSVASQCPGPNAFKCCQSAAEGFGGYDAPDFPGTSGGCKQVAIDGARWVVGQFPKRIREIFCTRDCACDDNPSSDHCCGKAIDFMCSDDGGAPTSSGREIAEWIMTNRARRSVKYIIWGQRIWEATEDAVGPWTEWRSMEDRGDVTSNHWDHVHVSFN